MGMSGQQFQTLGRAAGMGAVGAGLFGMLDPSENPADAAMGSLNQIQGSVSPYYQPYFKAGSNQIPGLQSEYSNLTQNPGGMINQIGSNFQQSPGFKFALQQALQGSNQAAAAGGMAGSPQAQQQAMGVATNLGNQDYYNWMNQATGLFGQGLQGQQGMYAGGLGAGDDMATQIAQALNAKAQLQYQGQAAQNQQQGSMIGDITGGLGMLAAFA